MRSAMCAASQLPGRGPLLWIWPLYLHVNQKFDDDDDDPQFKREKEMTLLGLLPLKMYLLILSCMAIP